MMTPSAYYTVLTCHPGTYTDAVRTIEAHVCWTQHRALAFTYALKGDLSRLRIPPPRPPREGNGLWQHTCFEAFVSVNGKPDYYEFNFSPSREWGAYTFRHYRDGAPLKDAAVVPNISVRSAGDSLDLDAIVRLDRLPKIAPDACGRLALSAVIEENRGILSYWALKHPPGKPDFHHPDAFTLKLAPLHLEAGDEPAMGKR